MKRINGLLVVEGKSDESRIKSIIDCDIFVTNGYDVKEEDIAFLKEVRKNKQILVLTDPDEAGSTIRTVLEKNITNIQSIFVRYEFCDKHHKHGVAECKEGEIIKALKPYIVDVDYKPLYGKEYLYEKGLIGDSNSFKKRKYLCEKLHIKNCSTKNVIKSLNLLEVPIRELDRILINYED